MSKRAHIYHEDGAETTTVDGETIDTYGWNVSRFEELFGQRDVTHVEWVASMDSAIQGDLPDGVYPAERWLTWAEGCE